MMLILKWKEMAENLKQKHKQLRLKYFWIDKKFVAILFFGKSNPSQIYVNLKQKYAQEIWFDYLIFWQWKTECGNEYSDLTIFQEKNYKNKDEIIELIKKLNLDERCVWIICQLPLTDELKPHQQEICNSISPIKDIDWLWDNLQNRAFEWKIDFLPATAQAVISLLNKYNLADFEWKEITVIWQSAIVWRPIATYLKLHGGNVHIFDITNTLEEIIQQTKQSDLIISCTGSLHLIDDKFINSEKNQILIDVWYGFLDGQSTWDVNFKKVENKVYAISPVPWWVWPMTVASLFGNIFTIWQQREKILEL